jgi:hypothetical protein
MRKLSSHALTREINEITEQSSNLLQIGRSLRDQHDKLTGHATKILSPSGCIHRLENDRSRVNIDMKRPQNCIARSLFHGGGFTADPNRKVVLPLFAQATTPIDSNLRVETIVKIGRGREHSYVAQVKSGTVQPGFFPSRILTTKHKEALQRRNSDNRGRKRP